MWTLQRMKWRGVKSLIYETYGTIIIHQPMSIVSLMCILQMSSSRLPLVQFEKVHCKKVSSLKVAFGAVRESPLYKGTYSVVQCEGDSTDLNGDNGCCGTSSNF